MWLWGIFIVKVVVAAMYIPVSIRESFRKLVEMTRRLGRAPSFKEVLDDPSMPNPNDFAYYFGSYTEASRRACYEALGSMRAKYHIESKKEREEKMGRKSTPREELLTELIVLEDKLGHFPTPNEVRGDAESKTYTTYIKALGGSWKTVAEAVAEERKRRSGESGDSDEVLSKIQEQRSWPEQGGEMTTDVTQALPVSGESVLADADEAAIATGETSVEVDISAESSEKADGVDIRSENLALEGAEKGSERVIVSLLPYDAMLVPGNTSRAWRELKADLSRKVLILDAVIGVVDDFFASGSSDDISVKRRLRKVVILEGQKMVDFPEPRENVYYLVEKDIAVALYISGRATEDILFAEAITSLYGKKLIDDLRVL